MWIYGAILIFASCITFSAALELEEFLSSLGSKKEKDDESSTDENQEPVQMKDEELVQLVKRSGLIAPTQGSQSTSNDAQNNQNMLQLLKSLQSLNRQQNLMVYAPEYAQASSSATTQQRSPRAIGFAQPVANLPYSYQSPSSKDASQMQQSKQQYNPQYVDPLVLAALQKQSQQQTTADVGSNLAYSNAAYQQQANPTYSSSQKTSKPSYSTSQQASNPSYSTSQQASNPSYATSQQASNPLYSTSQQASNPSYSTSQQASNPSYSISQQENKDATSAVKDDRQGQYAYDAYDPGYASRSPVAYSGQHGYAHEPEQKHLSLPIPSVAIKFDPLGLLKLLLSGLPRPLFNLNGKIFLGLELGKNVGLSKGKAPYVGGGGGGGHGGYGGGERVISIG